MTYKNGFLVGLFAGVFITLFATGQIIVITYTENFRGVAILILFLIFLFGLAVTANQGLKRQSLISPSADGFISGIAFIEAIIVFLLYGKFF